MQAAATLPVPLTVSRPALWTGRILAGFMVLFLGFDAIAKLPGIPAVVEANAHLGFQPWQAVVVGVIELICVALYALPRTSLLGAVLLTACLGGACAVQFRITESYVFPVVIGAIVWAGLLLRRPALLKLLI